MPTLLTTVVSKRGLATKHMFVPMLVVDYKSPSQPGHWLQFRGGSKRGDAPPSCTESWWI